MRKGTSTLVLEPKRVYIKNTYTNTVVEATVDLGVQTPGPYSRSPSRSFNDSNDGSLATTIRRFVDSQKRGGLVPPFQLFINVILLPAGLYATAELMSWELPKTPKQDDFLYVSHKRKLLTLVVS